MAPSSYSADPYAHTKASIFLQPNWDPHAQQQQQQQQQLLLPIFLQNSSIHRLARRRTFVPTNTPPANRLLPTFPALLHPSCPTPCNISLHSKNRRIGRTSSVPATPVQGQGSSHLIREEEAQEHEQKGESGGKQPYKVKGSAQLARWARARRIRLGVRQSSDAVIHSQQHGATVSDRQRQMESTRLVVDQFDSDGLEEDDDGSVERAGEKAAFLVSDGTGWTVDHSVHAALGQFEHCLADRGCSVNTHLFSEVDEVDRLMEIIRQAGEEGAIVIFTLADPTMAEAAKRACEMVGVPHLDILGPITLALGNHLRVSPSGLPRGAPGRKHVLSKQYFKRIEAVEFTIKQDDGALPKNLHLADLILVGVSRTSKTPLSTYMAQMGYKVANVPLVLGIDPPKQLCEVDQDKVYGLTINPNFLKSIRLTRYKHLGVADNSHSSYFDGDCIRKELEYSSNLFRQNPRWPVIEVTGKAIEETAAAILRIYHERKSKHAMPRISKRY